MTISPAPPTTSMGDRGGQAQALWFSKYEAGRVARTLAFSLFPIDIKNADAFSAGIRLREGRSSHKDRMTNHLQIVTGSPESGKTNLVDLLAIERRWSNMVRDRVMQAVKLTLPQPGTVHEQTKRLP